MSKKYDFEYIVIGSGPAGSSAALTLAKTKKRVGLVEGRFFGGTNINTRDIPYDIALNFSRLYDELLTAPEFSHQDFSFNFSSNVAHQQDVVLDYSSTNQKADESAGIVCLQGYANFLDSHTIAVGKQKITSQFFIIFIVNYIINFFFY